MPWPWSLEEFPVASSPEPSPGRDDPRGTSELTLSEAQRRVDAWIQTHGVRYFSELTNLAQLVEEVGELARIISRTHGEQSYREGTLPGDLGDEMADVLFVLICLANQTGIDLDEALRRNLEKKTRRDSERHRNNPKLSEDSAGPS